MKFLKAESGEAARAHWLGGEAADSFQPDAQQNTLLKYHPEITKALNNLTLELWHHFFDPLERDRDDGIPPNPRM